MAELEAERPLATEAQCHARYMGIVSAFKHHRIGNSPWGRRQAPIRGGKALAQQRPGHYAANSQLEVQARSTERQLRTLMGKERYAKFQQARRQRDQKQKPAPRIGWAMTWISCCEPVPCVGACAASAAMAAMTASQVAALLVMVLSRSFRWRWVPSATGWSQIRNSPKAFVCEASSGNRKTDLRPSVRRLDRSRRLLARTELAQRFRLEFHR